MAGAGRSLDKEAFWRLVLDEHEASGLTVRAFCKQESLSEPSFYTWRKELRKRDQESAVVQESRLLPVEIVGGSAVSTPPRLTSERNSSAALEVVTPTGYTLRLEQDVDPCRPGQLLSAVASVTAEYTE